MDRNGLLARLVSIQVEVLRRVTERKQERLALLVSERTGHAAHADSQFASHRLPSLPPEIIAQIFRQLYFVESKAISYIYFPANLDAKSTVWAFIEDRYTPNDWKHIIGREIPLVVVQEGGLPSELGLNQVQSLLGTQPRIAQPGAQDNASIPTSSATVLLTAKGWPELKDRLNSLFQFTWRCLILAYHTPTHRTDPQVNVEMVNTMTRLCGPKLAELDRLVIDPFCNSVFGTGDDREGDYRIDTSAENTFEGAVENLKLRSASLPLHSLPLRDLRRYLAHVTELEVYIPANSASLRRDVLEECCRYLQPFLDTLMKLILSVVSLRFSDRIDPSPGGPRRPNLFPKLKSLSLSYSLGCITRDGLECFDCPSLVDLSILSECNRHGRDRTSAASLHRAFPLLQTIAFSMEDLPVCLHIL